MHAPSTRRIAAVLILASLGFFSLLLGTLGVDVSTDNGAVLSGVLQALGMGFALGAAVLTMISDLS